MEKQLERYVSDFSLWARECVKIIDKATGREVPFVMNAPQRRVLELMEQQRRAGKPVRVIMLKARQWGGSTLVQIYMAWLQLVVRRGWNSLTCAHIKDASASIRGMYSRLLRAYPEELKIGKKKDWELSPYEKSTSVGYLAARDCQVAIATALSPNSVRGSNFALAHLSEVAFWADGDEKAAEEIVRTVSGTVLRCPDSVIVMESTANGKENYFYKEWNRAVKGESDKLAVFVPWHEIELYSRPVDKSEVGQLLLSFDEYERDLLASGVALESVAWYHDKRREYQSHEAMMAEFPSTAEEAFAVNRSPVFPVELQPELSIAENEMPNFAVFVPGDGRAKHTFLEFKLANKLHVLHEEKMNGSLGEAMREVVSRSRCLSMPLMIVESVAPECRPHGTWCGGFASEQGVAVVYDEDDAPCFNPDGQILSEWIDEMCELLKRGRVVENSKERVDYASFRYDSPWRTPQILARVAAAHYLSRYGAPGDYSMLF